MVDVPKISFVVQLFTRRQICIVCYPEAVLLHISPRESVGIMFLPALVCVSVCDHDNYKECGQICTKFYGKVPRGKGRPSSCFVTIGRRMWM